MLLHVEDPSSRERDRNIITGVEIRFSHLGASRAPSIGKLGALIRIWGPNYSYHLIKRDQDLDKALVCIPI